MADSPGGTSRDGAPAVASAQAAVLPAPEEVSASRVAMGAGVALGLLVLGAAAMGISPIFVRNAEVGPFASAFWRVFAALPLLAVWSLAERRPQRRGGSARPRVDPRAVALAGLFFAGDLAFWHLAIMHTTIANATFFACLAPLWVALLSRVTIGEAVAKTTFLGLLVCVPGAALLILHSGNGEGSPLGDFYGLVTSLFFGLYFLAVRQARAALGAGTTTLVSTVVTAAILLPVAIVSGEGLLPHSATGAFSIAALGLVSHAGGQGLLSVALGVLSASFSSLVIFVEAVAAALFAWIFAGETPALAQVAGGCLILFGIYLASPRRPIAASSNGDGHHATLGAGR
ncbi:DMT family transporter [Jiella endophytica]|uniref:DMT family transporter n=1 Tax=Jiella endophytica TaxID=2558362 RepID=A0A4Y8RUL9_9HYPH|nr:DMT family transporter [Jiella endophytica]TFF27643.1 DMT family transporter [Jiella endophytica]